MTAAMMAADDATRRDAELRALERAMGAVAVEDSQEWGGEIAEDDDEDSDREAVVYDDDALFDDDDPLPAQGDTTALVEPVEPSSLAGLIDEDALFDDDGPLSPQEEAAVPVELAEPADLAELLGGGSAESSSALIAYLEQMAEGLEAQSGEEEREIRGKIAVLRGVLEARSGARSGVTNQSSCLGGDKGGGPEEGDALTSLGGLQELASESLQRIEHGMGAVDSLLQDDDARQLLAESAHVWMPAIGVVPHAGGEREAERPLSTD